MSGKREVNMAKIILSNAARNGIQGTTSRSMGKASKSYQKLVKESDERISQSRRRYVTAYKKASTYLTH